MTTPDEWKARVQIGTLKQFCEDLTSRIQDKFKIMEKNVELADRRYNHEPPQWFKTYAEDSARWRSEMEKNISILMGPYTKAVKFLSWSGVIVAAAVLEEGVRKFLGFLARHFQ